MECWTLKIKGFWSSFMQKKIITLILLCLFSTGGVFASETGKIKIDVNICAVMAVKKLPKEASEELRVLAVLKAKEHFYRYLMNFDMVDMVREVKKNFDSAVEKSEERFEAEDVNISQTDILKLKLGLVGVTKDLNGIERDMERAKVELLEDLGLDRGSSLEFPKKGLVKVKIELPSLDSALESAKKNKSPFSPIEIEKRLIDLVENHENAKFIKKGRKYARGLLVVALANFDMGIGEGKELFEALYIYNRAVRDYVKGIYKFNLAAARLSGIIGEDIEVK